MNITLYDFMESMLGFYSLFLTVGSIIQIFITLKMKWMFGLMLPIYALVCSLFWMSNPIREGHMPTMTAMNSLPYLLLIVVYLVIFAVCTYFKKKYSK